MSVFPETIYMIKTPFIAKSLTKSYNKQIRIATLEIDSDSTGPNKTYKMYNVIDGKEWEKSKWKTLHPRTICDCTSIGVHGNHIYDSTLRTKPSKSVFAESRLFFPSFEMAYISKIFILQHFQVLVREEINNRLKTFEKNYVDLKWHLEIISDKYPEYLL